MSIDKAYRKAEKALEKEFQKWLKDGSDNLRDEKEVNWLTDITYDESHKWRFNYEGVNYIWEYFYNSGKIEKVNF